LVNGGWDSIARQYVFDARPLTNDRPYFAGYVKPRDLPQVLGRLDALQDDWGYLLIWATFIVACLLASLLIAIPALFSWRSLLSHARGRTATMLYFGCLGFGYIAVEVGLISRFTEALGNATVSATVLIAGMLVFSGVGSLASERILGRARAVLPAVLTGVAFILIVYSLWSAPLLGWIGTLPNVARLILCFALVAPPAFLMGFPMPTAMTLLARNGKTEMFVWAWGINGCLSVVGAAAEPLLATTFGLAAVLQWSSAAYLIAIPAFFVGWSQSNAKAEPASVARAATDA
jgi:hypothetical protein